MNAISWQTKALKQMRKLPARAGKAIRESVTAELSDLDRARNVKKLTDDRAKSAPRGNNRAFRPKRPACSNCNRG